MENKEGCDSCLNKDGSKCFQEKMKEIFNANKNTPRINLSLIIDQAKITAKLNGCLSVDKPAI